jgi:hypothetical protein
MSKSTRRPKAQMHPLGTSALHLRHPWVIAFWSITFPGFGYLLLHRYFRGYLLIVWEILINYKSKVNMALFFSFTGRPELAQDVINLRWYLLYGSVYIFSIWDSYRGCVDGNKLAVLADHENAPIPCFKMNILEYVSLDKRKPWNAVMWSVLMPGLGQIFVGRVHLAFFILTWWIVISYQSHLIEAVHYTCLTDFHQATAVLDPQWALFMPSIYGFAIYDSFVNTVEMNKLMKVEQIQYLKKEYQKIELQTILRRV